jgi:apolipoprotein N-acyltransferase
VVAWSGFWFGAAFFTGAVYWVVPVMGRYGGLAWSVAASILVLMVGFLALFSAAFAAWLHFMTVRLGAGAALALAPAAWVALELLRNYLFTGFPWVRLGTALHASRTLLQAASLAGVYGLSALVLAGAAGLAWVVRRPRCSWALAHLSLVLALTLAAHFWGRERARALEADGTAGDAALEVACVQGNVPQGHKWKSDEAAAIVARHLELTRQAAGAGAELVIWPESSMPFALRQNPEFAGRVREVARRSGVALLIGSLDVRAAGAPGREVYNSAFLLGEDGRIRGVYDKTHLVPFGEYVPLRRLLFFASSLVEEVGDLRAGSGEQPLATQVGGGATPGLGVLICYEIIFSELSRQAVRAGASVLANLTNDAWFGRTSAPYQHFAEAVMRAVETGRWVVRAANTGISGIISPSGRVAVRTELGQVALAQAQVRPRHEVTLYVRTGDVFAWACAILALVAMLLDRIPALAGHTPSAQSVQHQ